MGSEWSKLVLYGGAPFFAYPFKPFMNAAMGAPYARAYAHFRRDHDQSANLAFHVVCFVFQLTNNFGLLAELEDKLGKWPVLSLPTAALWSATLVADTSAPLEVKALSVACIAAAFALRKRIQRGWMQLMTVQAIIETLAIQIFLINKREHVPFDAPQFAAILAARLALQQFVLKPSQGALAKYSAAINVAVGVFMLKTCQDPFGDVPPFLFGLVGFAASLLTGQRWMFFYSSGFVATLAQGVSHHLSYQPATMPQLSLISDELAHSTYFPALLLQSVHESLAGAQAVSDAAA